MKASLILRFKGILLLALCGVPRIRCDGETHLSEESGVRNRATPYPGTTTSSSNAVLREDDEFTTPRSAVTTKYLSVRHSTEAGLSSEAVPSRDDRVASSIPEDREVEEEEEKEEKVATTKPPPSTRTPNVQTKLNSSYSSVSNKLKDSSDVDNSDKESLTNSDNKKQTMTFTEEKEAIPNAFDETAARRELENTHGVSLRSSSSSSSSDDRSSTTVRNSRVLTDKPPKSDEQPPIVMHASDDHTEETEARASSASPASSTKPVSDYVNKNLEYKTADVKKKTIGKKETVENTETGDRLINGKTEKPLFKESVLKTAELIKQKEAVDSNATTTTSAAPTHNPEALDERYSTIISSFNNTFGDGNSVRSFKNITLNNEPGTNLLEADSGSKEANGRRSSGPDDAEAKDEESQRAGGTSALQNVNSVIVKNSVASDNAGGEILNKTNGIIKYATIDRSRNKTSDLTSSTASDLVSELSTSRLLSKFEEEASRSADFEDFRSKVEQEERTTEKWFKVISSKSSSSASFGKVNDPSPEVSEKSYLDDLSPNGETKKKLHQPKKSSNLTNDNTVSKDDENADRFVTSSVSSSVPKPNIGLKSKLGLATSPPIRTRISGGNRGTVLFSPSNNNDDNNIITTSSPLTLTSVVYPPTTDPSEDEFVTSEESLTTVTVNREPLRKPITTFNPRKRPMKFTYFPSGPSSTTESYLVRGFTKGVSNSTGSRQSRKPTGVTESAITAGRNKMGSSSVRPAAEVKEFVPWSNRLQRVTTAPTETTTEFMEIESTSTSDNSSSSNQPTSSPDVPDLLTENGRDDEWTKVSSTTLPSSVFSSYSPPSLTADPTLWTSETPFSSPSSPTSVSPSVTGSSISMTETSTAKEVTLDYTTSRSMVQESSTSRTEITVDDIGYTEGVDNFTTSAKSNGTTESVMLKSNAEESTTLLSSSESYSPSSSSSESMNPSETYSFNNTSTELDHVNSTDTTTDVYTTDFSVVTEGSQGTDENTSKFTTSSEENYYSVNGTIDFSSPTVSTPISSSYNSSEGNSIMTTDGAKTHNNEFIHENSISTNAPSTNGHDLGANDLEPDEEDWSLTHNMTDHRFHTTTTPDGILPNPTDIDAENEDEEEKVMWNNSIPIETSSKIYDDSVTSKSENITSNSTVRSTTMGLKSNDIVKGTTRFLPIDEVTTATELELTTMDSSTTMTSKDTSKTVTTESSTASSTPYTTRPTKPKPTPTPPAEPILTVSEDVPAYLLLLVKGATWEEICQSRDSLKNAIALLFQNSTGRIVHDYQVVFINLSPEDCSRKEKDKSIMSIHLVLLDEAGNFDEGLNKEFHKLWEQRGLNTNLAVQEVYLMPAEYDNDKDKSNTETAAIVIASVAAVCLLLFGILMIVLRKRQRKFSYGQRCTPVSLDDYSLDNISVYNSVRRKHAMRASKRSYGNPAFDDPGAVLHPMNFAGLANFCTNRKAIDDEFSEIPMVSPKMDELPPGAETKNRYANVIPLPETRVQLSVAEGEDPLTNYINANYVKGPKGAEKFYIACQAPMQSTVNDFWKMIWEQQCKLVLMLTDLHENGVEKCVDYLPPSEVLDCHRLFGDYQVTLKKREVREKYVISLLQLKNLENNLWREVTHMWYTSWPHQGVPEEGTSIIAFLIEARSFMRSTSGPHVVHCSPGVGRTGTVLAIDLCIREFETSRMVDIPKTVYALRRDRAGSVQTKDQYAFIYTVLNIYGTKLTGGALDSI